MPRVQVSIQEFAFQYFVIFIDPVDNRKIGPTRRYSSAKLIFEMLRRACADADTMDLVETALRERRPCMIWLDLTDEQINGVRNPPKPRP